MVAGLTVAAYDRLAARSSKLFAPDGLLIRKPLKNNAQYNRVYSDSFLNEAANYASRLSEKEDVSSLLVYVDYNNQQTDEFRQQFFPFCLTNKVMPPLISDEQSNFGQRKALEDFIDSIVLTVQKLREAARNVHAALSGNNITPLLLPVKNFRSRHLQDILQELFTGLANSENYKESIEKARGRILHFHPWQHPENERQRCLSDGTLFFKSPGKNRHGFFQNSAAKQHPPSCLLSARSRLGGSYSHVFHYDCTPVTGDLPTVFNKCHGEPKTIGSSTHVNIAPNDYIV